jgi:hypothetical protein
MNARHRDILFFFILACVTLFLYWEPIKESPRLQFDDVALVTPMTTVHSVNDYLTLWRDNVILDIQPIRDLSYILEARVSDLTGFMNCQLVNLLIWLVVLVIYYQIILIEDFPSSWAKFILAYLAFHPVAVNSIAWASGRKHLLSLLFISSATFYWLRWLKSEHQSYARATVILFAASCFSQPINVAWFLWAGFTAWQTRKIRPSILVSSRSILIYCAIIGAGTAFINFWYYSSWRYLNISLGKKFIAEEGSLLANRLLIFGRYLVQLSLPIKPSIVPYNPGSSLAILGVVFIPLFLWVLWGLRTQHSIISKWLLFLILPLAVVSGPSNQHFGWDPYLLTPLIGWTILLSVFFKFYIKKVRHNSNFATNSILITVALIILAFAIQTKYAANAWANEDTLWTTALQREAHPMAIVAAAKLALHKHGDTHSAWDLTMGLLNAYPKHPELPYLIGRTIYDNKNLSVQEKSSLFEKYNQEGAWFVYYSAAFAASQKQFDFATEKMATLFKANEIRAIQYFGPEISGVAANYYAMCEFAKRPDCNERILAIKATLAPSMWDRNEFSKRLSLFNLQFN